MKGLLSCCLAVIVGLPATSFAFTGNDLYDWGVQFEKENGTPVSAVSFGYVGYVSGAMDSMNQIMFCAPKKVTYSQAASVFMKYLRNNPEVRDKPAPDLIVEAMAKPYPCAK
ncbi:hypothetical protein C4K03_1280 [Pseudomonas synxantha]|uniref:Rap1a immunity protein domain-containing protein n=1 Tax=Pseudomonas synxantha TaxID=47883 RepID=A0A3G7U2S0_9PSED|nr:Rap1a/Tai family immunity protein [Pseudomonas synxantha]AZE53451.1 hypothetical protein C4K03_1280 [Pseudomonas synxantha]